MHLNPLTAISPIDGRYFQTTSPLSAYFSEYAMIHYRIRVEIEYFIALCEWPLKELEAFPKAKFELLRSWYSEFDEDDAQKIKDLEKVTNHDVKAVEYFLKEKFDQHGLSAYKEFIHFGLTSQDINNTATPLIYKEFLETQFLPCLKSLVKLIEQVAMEWKEVSMLARTHGQPASPTRMGKELMVFSERIKQQITLLLQIPFAAKFGGAIGTPIFRNTVESVRSR